MMPQNNAPANGPAFVNNHANVPVISLAISLPIGAAKARNRGAAIRNDNAPEKTMRKFLGIFLSMKWNINEKIHTDNYWKD